MSVSDAEMKEVFDLIDKDKDGNLTAAELGTALRAVGQNPTETELQQIAQSVGGKCNFQSFKGKVTQLSQSGGGESELRDAFSVFDRNGDGYVAVAEMKHVLTTICEKLAPAEADELLKDADPDGDGQINIEEFIQMLTAK
eukprot:TRINITY_DN14711_c0_g1_i1.p1 TRINITY_DN14711_c0_g1~~TRINITY_DN14711_c0_g1_i1.p1  ORF type:complete len:141 (+),score=41.38 TRINITY_DN14711_c0_g1_i1:168-590(+)